MHDHIGFGFSDKPVTNFTYSVLSEHADVAISLWSQFAAKNAILIAHDMGLIGYSPVPLHFERCFFAFLEGVSACIRKRTFLRPINI